MAKHKHKKKKPKKARGYRNASPPAMPARRPPRRASRGRRNAPDGWTAVAAVAGGVGGSLLGGYAAREGLDARWVGAGLAAAGGLAAWRYDGRMRAFASGVAAAGGGQAVLELLDRDEQRPDGDKKKDGDKKPAKDGDKVAAADAATKPAEGRLANSRHGGDGLDRAFNRVRERLQRIYDDEDESRFVEEDAA